ncbi:MAG: rod shape-determining protein MreC [Legionellales bacterium]|nr:rod shape-determining protein MreC [Legionellales bacterium]
MAVISFQPSNNQNKLFAKSGHSSSGLVLALVLSFVFMLADAHYHSFTLVRSGLSLLVSPLQYMVDYPVRVVGWVSSLFSTKKSLIDENMQLRYHQMILEAQLQKLTVLTHENSQLKALLSASASAQMNAMAAQILAVDTTISRQLVVLDKGSRDGVLVGLPVMDAKGVVGQIIDVGLMTSTVLLISDSKSAVPVRNNRTGERAILVGTNSMSRLSLVNLPRTSTTIRGDLLVTSGLGRRYPEGYPVGRVEEVSMVPGDDFIKVMVTPVAMLNQNRLVLVVWPEEGHEEVNEQIKERMSVMDEAT